MTRTVRIPDATLARHPDTTAPPPPHTAAELDRLLALLQGVGARSVAVGHGRHENSRRAAEALVEAWDRAAGTVLDVVSWPADAASWLRPARRLVTAAADAIVVADTPAGFAQLYRRLHAEPGWSATRTLGFAGIGHPDLITLAAGDLTGLSGATADGSTWRFGRRLLILDPA